MALVKLVFSIGTVVIAMASIMWAGSIGQIWECRSNPKEGVTVRFKEGPIESGTLTCNWDSTRVLIVPDKGEITFRHTAIDYMTYPVRKDLDGDGFTAWRLFTPMFLALVMVYGGMYWLYRLVKHKNAN